MRLMSNFRIYCRDRPLIIELVVFFHSLLPFLAILEFLLFHHDRRFPEDWENISITAWQKCSGSFPCDPILSLDECEMNVTSAYIRKFHRATCRDNFRSTKAFYSSSGCSGIKYKLTACPGGPGGPAGPCLPRAPFCPRRPRVHGHG